MLQNLKIQGVYCYSQKGNAGISYPDCRKHRNSAEKRRNKTKTGAVSGRGQGGGITPLAILGEGSPPPWLLTCLLFI